MSDQDLETFFRADHRAADRAWAEVEAAVESGDGERVQAAAGEYLRRMERHFRMEEEVLFPAFEERTGMSGGPTAVMRMEHDQMRGLLTGIEEAPAAGRFDEILDLGDSLLLLVQQHNQKEETVLYPMAREQLADEWPALAERLAGY